MGCDGCNDKRRGNDRGLPRLSEALVNKVVQCDGCKDSFFNDLPLGSVAVCPTCKYVMYFDLNQPELPSDNLE